VDVETTLVGFARALRAADLAVTADRTAAFVAAVAEVGAGTRDGVYWAGRATLCSEPEDVAVYDKVFDAWFSGRLERGVSCTECGRFVDGHPGAPPDPEWGRRAPAGAK